MFLFDSVFNYQSIRSFKYASVQVHHVFSSNKNTKHLSKTFIVALNKLNHNTKTSVVKIKGTTYKKPLYKITNIFNIYWKKRIFLSFPRLRLIKSVGLIRIKNRSSREEFLFQLNQGLINGTINANLDKRSNDLANYRLKIKYVSQSIYLNILQKSNKVIHIINKVIHKKYRYKQNSNSLMLDQFPVFTLVNRFNEIVTSEPSDELLRENGLFVNFYEWCLFNLGNSTKVKYKSWFFISPKDAREFYNYIKYRYPSTAQLYGLSIAPVNLSVYYRMSRLSYSTVEFRLIPDLDAVSSLINQQKENKNLYFYTSQKYRQDFFKGQPIYLLHYKNPPSFSCGNIFLDIAELFDPEILYHPLNELHKHIINQYRHVYTSYDVATKAAEKLDKCLQKSNFDSFTTIIAYNLEDFLVDLKETYNTDMSHISFIPSKDTYEFIKRNKKKLLFSSNVMLFYFKSIKLFFTKIISSLKSTTLAL